VSAGGLAADGLVEQGDEVGVLDREACARGRVHLGQAMLVAVVAQVGPLDLDGQRVGGDAGRVLGGRLPLAERHGVDDRDDRVRDALPSQVLQRRGRVLDHVVQPAGGDRLGRGGRDVAVGGGQVGGDARRMADVRVPRLVLLPFVGADGDVVGPLDQQPPDLLARRSLPPFPPLPPPHPQARPLPHIHTA